MGEIGSFIGNVLPLRLMESGIFIVGYSVAYIFHILSWGYLFQLVEFRPYSCLIGSCGWPDVRGGPDGMGFSHGRIGNEIQFPTPKRDPNRMYPIGEGDGGGGDGV